MTAANKSTYQLPFLLLMLILLLADSSTITAETIPQAPLPEGWTWIAASDSNQVTRTGDWKPDRFRYAHSYGI